MPKQKTNRYSIRDTKYKSFAAAAEAAVLMSLQQESDVAITEYDPNTDETFYINVTASSEEA